MIPLCIPMLVLAVTTQELVGHLADGERCVDAANELGVVGREVGAAFGPLVETIARGNRCSPAAAAAISNQVRYNNPLARSVAELVRVELTEHGQELNPVARRYLVEVFGRVAQLRQDGREILTRALSDPDIDVARTAAVALGAHFSPEEGVTAKLDVMLHDPEQRLRAAQLVASAASCTRFVPWLSRAVELLALDASLPEYETIVGLVYASLLEPQCRAEAPDAGGHPNFLLHMTAHANEQVAAHCARMLGRTWPNERIVAELAYRLVEPPHPTPFYRAAVIEGLAQSGRAAVVALALLQQSLESDSPSVRRASIDALQMLGPTAHASAHKLADLAEHDPDALVRKAASDALAVIVGVGIEPRNLSRQCQYRLRGWTQVCCDAECPRWADRGSRATVDVDRKLFAGIGVSADGNLSRSVPGEDARAILSRFLSYYLEAAVIDFLRAAPRSNAAVGDATRAQKALRADFDPTLRKRVLRFVAELLASVKVSEQNGSERATLVSVRAEDLLIRARQMREGAPADLVAAIERSIGVTFMLPDAVTPAPGDPQPDWVTVGSGLFVTRGGLELRGLGASSPRPFLDDPTRAAEGAAFGLLVDVLAGFSSHNLEVYRKDGNEVGNHLVGSAESMAVGLGRIAERWQDQADGRHYALATLQLSGYLAFLARLPDIDSHLRRFLHERADKVFRQHAQVLAADAGATWVGHAAPDGMGMAVPTSTRVSSGAVTWLGEDMIVVSLLGSSPTLLAINPDGGQVWSRPSPIGWTRLAPTRGGLLAAGVDLERRVHLAWLSGDGEIAKELPTDLLGWGRVAAVASADGGAVYLALDDRGPEGNQKTVLARVDIKGRVSWRREFAGWGTVSLPSVLPFWPGVLALSHAGHCLDPHADNGCDGDPICGWNAAHARCGWNKALTRYDVNGRLLWEQHFKLEGRPTNVVLTLDGGFAFATVSTGRVSVIHVEQTGRVRSTYTIAAPIADVGSGLALRATGDGGLMLVGVSEHGDALVLEIDRHGNLARQRSFGGLGRDVAFASFAAPRGLLVVGATDSLDVPGGRADSPDALHVVLLDD